MTTPVSLDHVKEILCSEQAPVGDRAEALIKVIRERHGGKVKALLFYGSSLRAGENSGKMLDFYVLVDAYSDIYGKGLKCLGAVLAPPGVHYCEADGPGGERLRSKYSIISLSAFHRRTRGAAFETMLWARFAQPTIIVCDDDVIRASLLETLAMASHHFLIETAPLVKGEIEPDLLWVRGLRESYRTELRPEDANGRAQQIVDTARARYAALALVVFPEMVKENLILKDAGIFRRNACRVRWFWRRVIGKPMGAFRVLKAFFTFDDGLNYILEKIHSHSGVTIDVSENERKRPLVHSPILAWKLFRQGAFR